VHAVAHRRRAQRILADGAEHRADGRAHDAQREHDADEIAEREERIEFPAVLEHEGREAEVERRRRDARQAVLAAGPIRERIEFDEEEDFGDRHRDHGEVDSRASQRDQPDQVADARGNDHADQQREHDMRESRPREQVRRHHAAGAVQGRLSEREQSGVAEKYVEADAEHAPDEDAVDGVRRRAQVGQHERRRNQRRRRQRLDDERALRGAQAIGVHSRPFTPSSPCGRAMSTSAMAANSIT